MTRKMVTIHDEIIHLLQTKQITTNYGSFSEMVTDGLRLLIEKEKKDQYKKAMVEASKDRLYIEDMEEIERDFAFVDTEGYR
jgi:hypothetical protein